MQVERGSRATPRAVRFLPSHALHPGGLNRERRKAQQDLKRHHQQRFDRARIENDDALTKPRLAALEHDPVLVLPGGKGDRAPVVLHNAVHHVVRAHFVLVAGLAY